MEDGEGSKRDRARTRKRQQRPARASEDSKAKEKESDRLRKKRRLTEESCGDSTRTVGSEQKETAKLGGEVVSKLGPGDLLEVLTALFDLRADWENIGVALKVTDGTLRAIGAQHNAPKDCLRDLLREWLNTSDASWSSLVGALRHPIVGQGNLAAELERKCLTQTGSGQSTATCEPDVPDPQLGPMELFADSLMAEYERVSATCEEKLYPTPTAEYTNLAVIKKEVSREKADKFTRSTLHGGLDEIMREKEPVNLENIFKPDSRRQAVNYVLVEGAPGVGKSTFALELCRRWRNIQLMKRFVAVVLLRLREKRVQEAKSVTDLLYHDDDDIKKEVVKQVRSSSGENILLVLDGFDELPSHLQRSSFVADMIRGRCLKKATILVTSRPSARLSVCNLRPRPHKHIEVLGFTSDLIDHYAKSVYGEDPRLLADFRTYVNTNPTIKSMMYVPLNSAIVVEIYQEYRTEGRPIPQTMTQLYTELTLVRIRSYFTDQYDQPLDSLPVKLEDLSKDFRGQLYSLAKLAFDGCKDKEVIFDRLPDGCTSLGLMTASQEMYVGKKGAVNYNFFHLTHQEFLAALHISHLTLAEKREIFQCLEVSLSGTPELSVVWKFVVGLVGFEDIGWDEHVPWLGRLLFSNLPKEEEGEEKEEEVTPFLAQCLYEAQEKVKWENLSEVFCVRFDSPDSPLDCFTVGYCVAASRWVWDFFLSQCNLGLDMVEMLGCGLNSRQDINGSIRKLNLFTNPIGLEGVAHLQKLPEKILQGISFLNVRNCELDSAALDLLSCLVPTMTSMRKLSIAENPVGHGGTVNILKALSTVNQLQTLVIWGIDLSPTDIMALSPLILPSVGCVKDLLIGGTCMMTCEHAEMMLEAVLCPSSLESLTLVGVHLTPRVATLLQDNHNLIKLTINGCTPGTLSHIAEGLHNQSTLRELRVIEQLKQQGAGDIIVLSEMLRKNQSLKTMTLEARFSGQDVQRLISALQDNHTLEQLSLEYRGIGKAPELHADQLDPRVSVRK